MEKLLVKYFDDSLPELVRIEGRKSDWIDLYSREDIALEKGQRYNIPLNVAIKLPEGYEAIMAPRSSTFKRYGILQTNSVGIVDEAYCGNNDEWMFPAYAVRNTVIDKGSRIAQFRIIRHQPEICFQKTEVLEDKDRGGIGSTGI